MASLQIQAPPLNEPVDMDTLKTHLRVTIANDDALIAIYLQAARELVEAESGRSLVNKVYRQSHDRFPRLQDDRQAGSGFSYCSPRYANRFADMRQAIKLLRAPLVSVSKITYIDTAGVLQTLLPVPEAWQPDTEYVIGDVVAAHGFLQQVTEVSEAETGGTSISEESEPTWDDTPGNSTTDGDLVWVNKGAAPAGDFLVDRDSEPPRLMPLFSQSWPATLRVPNAVQIFFTAGYGSDPAAVPATLKVAVMMTVGVSYEFREAVTATLLRELDWYNRLIYSERVTDFNPTK